MKMNKSSLTSPADTHEYEGSSSVLLKSVNAIFSMELDSFLFVSYSMTAVKQSKVCVLLF